MLSLQFGKVVSLVFLRHRQHLGGILWFGLLLTLSFHFIPGRVFVEDGIVFSAVAVDFVMLAVANRAGDGSGMQFKVTFLLLPKGTVLSIAANLRICSEIAVVTAVVACTFRIEAVLALVVVQVDVVFHFERQVLRWGIRQLSQAELIGALDVQLEVVGAAVPFEQFVERYDINVDRLSVFLAGLHGPLAIE